MFRTVLIAAIVFFLQAFAAAQQPQSTPLPPSTPIPQATPQTQSVRPVGIRRPDNPFASGAVLEPNQLARRALMLDQFVSPLYRKPTSKEMTALAPSSRILGEYSTFLNSPNAGVFRLMPDVGYAANDKVVNVSEQCLKYTMPGAGSSYSFRTSTHRIRHLADLSLINGKLIITGIFMHGMMANIGDVPISSVSLSSAGMEFLSRFTPSRTSDDVIEAHDKLLKGVEHNGFEYSKAAPIVENSTYVLRSVAYRGKVVRSIRGISYNELNYDEREDVTVVFRIVEINSDGSTTIVWRKLADLESPKIKMPKAPDDTGNEDNK